MTVTAVLPSALWNEIREAARHPLETAGVLLASILHADNGDIRVLGHRMVWVDAASYLRREVDGMSIASEGYMHALGEAEELNSTAIWVHTHPGNGASPCPSNHDVQVDRQLRGLFQARTGSDYYGALIFAPRGERVNFTGHIGTTADKVDAIERLWVAGDRFHLIPSYQSPRSQLSPIFDRNVRAFGQDIQNTLGDLRIGIVGCGGTGSAVAEQLVRLGVRNLVLIDPDTLSESNVTRVYGSSRADVGIPKVEISAKHLSTIAPDGTWQALQAMVTTEAAARKLSSCDLIFGCTDDNAGRLVLSRMPTYLLTPVIDCGVLISGDSEGNINGIDGRITTIIPEQACMVCRDRIDLARASAELLTPEERRRRENEGYAPMLGRTEPAVVTFTTMVAAAAVSELLERLIGYGPEPRPSEVLLRLHDREMSTNAAVPRDGHYCHLASGKLGQGEKEPFLGQTWPA